MSFHDHLVVERRARLAAERLLEQKQAELSHANQVIAAHARKLSDQYVIKREEAETLRSENVIVRNDLERTQIAMMLAERRLWDSIETIRDGFAVFGTDGNMVAANSAYMSAFDGLEAVGPGIAYRDLLRLAVEEGIVDTDGEDRMIWCARMFARFGRPDIAPATVRLWNGQFVRMIDRRTRDGDIVTLALNITGTIRRERALKAARERAEAANRAKSAFLANMSHELRTPMNGVVGMADVLLESTLDDDQRLYVQTIRNSGEALLAIINDVLDYSKIEANRMTLFAEPFDLERTVAEVLTLLGPKAQEKGLRLQFDYDLFLPTLLVGDAGRIRQVVTNLVGNAVKFTDAGHVAVRVLGRTAGPGQRQVVLTVTDTGVGIPPDKLGHIFGEFNQVDDKTTRRHDGTGLGLAITRNLVDLMGGEIWVESQPGTGSCFGIRLTLPVAREDGAQRRVAEWIDRAFLLDPDEISRHRIEAQLAALDLPIVSVPNGEALRRAPPGPRDILVVSDPTAEKSACQRFRQLLSDTRPAATLVLTQSTACPAPEGVGPVHILRQPVLRATFLDVLERIPAPREIDAPPPPTTSAARRRLRVLAAEDNKTNQLVLSKMLGRLDIDLVFAADGEEAVRLFEADRPDIVFTDISMPVMDGKEAARRMRDVERREGRARCPIVAMTAHAMDGDAEAILAAGIDHYLTKPLRKADLVDHILASAPASVVPPVPDALREATA